MHLHFHDLVKVIIILYLILFYDIYVILIKNTYLNWIHFSVTEESFLAASQQSRAPEFRNKSLKVISNAPRIHYSRGERGEEWIEKHQHIHDPTLQHNTENIDILSITARQNAENKSSTRLSHSVEYEHHPPDDPSVDLSSRTFLQDQHSNTMRQSDNTHSLVEHLQKDRSLRIDKSTVEETDSNSYT